MREILKITRPAAPAGNKRVAAYCRVSVATDRTLHSLSTQVSYFSGLIQSTPGWVYAGVYSDEGISGTGTKKRKGFQQMIADAEAGRIDIILTKSIQRFARNTVDLLKAVRHLKDMGVEVRFEKEHIRSMSGDGELMLSILASFAQEESRSLSNYVKWGTHKRYQQGIPNGKFHIFGYRWKGNQLAPYPQEAELVKKIYAGYLDHVSAETMAEKLKALRAKSCYGKPLSPSTVREILRNVTYTGNFLFGKEYVTDPISGKSKVNRGEQPQYWVENTHEAIIPMELFQKVQEERKHRRVLGPRANWSLHTTCFTGKIKCGICGKSYRRSGKKQRKDPDEVYYVWICQTKARKSAKACPGKIIPEKMLMKVCAEVLGTREFDEQVFDEQIEKIVVRGEDMLEFHFSDGHVISKEWHSTARRDCWTAKKRKERSECMKRRWKERKQDGNDSHNSGNA